MKTLLLLRHAKSSWKHPTLTDHERPLNKRGIRDAPRMGRLLAELNLVPDLIITSTAKRAYKTAQKVAKACNYQHSIRQTDTLYHAGTSDFIHVLRTQLDDQNCVLMVAHNPGLEYLLFDLTGEAEILPTAALAQIVLAIKDWTEINNLTQGTLMNLWRPKTLAD